MTLADRQIVERKLAFMLKYLTYLKPFENLSLSDYLDDFEKQIFAERILHLVVEVASDVNSHLLVRVHQITPETYYSSFIEAGNYGFITRELAEELAPSSGLRNRLVHRYDEIDPEIVFRAVAKTLQYYPRYVQQINQYLEKENDQRV
ncbi:type VII toxin-antitoxin system HepT family RNase toxin [Candidatus Cyanaurora vandensis]|uniref:type VII toxin-antitoxin system HepT family RNase toxin n=1 Tax=Candidatus Cyanaurora vandensis TaxID=2714958 RepID=UPI00257D4755|nr:DUF86 domain-containing protein [Candidatus Cyanaurora vandensis]